MGLLIGIVRVVPKYNIKPEDNYQKLSVKAVLFVKK